MSLLWDGKNLDPEPFEVDAYLESIEWAEEKERTRKALAYINSQRPGMFVTGWGLLKFLAGIVFFGLLGWLLLIEAFAL